jgi:hypothetical protein
MADYRFYAFFTALKVGKTGITVTCDVYDSAGVSQVSGAAVVAIGGGLYTYTHTDATPDDYAAIFKTSDATVDFQHVPALAVKQVSLYVDAAVSSRAVAGDVTSGLTSQGYTTTRAGYLDVLNGLVAAIWAAANRTLTAFGFTVATNSDASVTAIKAKTDNLPADPASNTQVSTRLAASTYVAPDNSGISAIKAKVDAFLDAAISSVLAAVSMLKAGSVYLVGPVVTGGDIEVISGNDYYAVDGRALTWSSDAWPSLAGAAITFECASVSVSATAAGVGTQVVTLELPAAKTSLLSTGSQEFKINATLENGHIVTLVRAKITKK